MLDDDMFIIGVLDKDDLCLSLFVWTSLKGIQTGTRYIPHAAWWTRGSWRRFDPAVMLPDQASRWASLSSLFVGLLVAVMMVVVVVVVVFGSGRFCCSSSPCCCSLLHLVVVLLRSSWFFLRQNIRPEIYLVHLRGRWLLTNSVFAIALWCFDLPVWWPFGTTSFMLHSFGQSKSVLSSLVTWLDLCDLST